jgi:hypothetical protein
MDFMKTGPEVVQAINQRWLLRRWKDLRNGNPLPLWRHLPIDDLKPMVETLMFCDLVPDAGGRFLIRYLGKRIAESYGGDFQGHYLDEALPAIWRDNALATYRKAMSGRRPVYNAVDTRDRNGRMVHLERLLLPFSRDGITADRILASIEAISLEGKFEHANLGRSPHATANCALVATIEMD